MVTPKNGTVFFKGRSGRTYAKNIYASDVAAAPVTWDSGAGVAVATSDSFWFAPEDVALKDIATISGPTVIFNLQLVVNGVATGDIFDYASQLNSLATRPALNIVIPGGSKIAFIQR